MRLGVINVVRGRSVRWERMRGAATGQRRAVDQSASDLRCRDPRNRIRQVASEGLSQQMQSALKSGFAGADTAWWPGFAADNFYPETFSSDGPVDLSSIGATSAKRYRKYLHIDFPASRPAGRTPAYSGPILVFGYDVASDGLLFLGTYDYGRKSPDGTLCMRPSVACS
jgi:hypothetical protein